jgi:1,4-dihydroxy-2-naphthoyl-CoA synthase
MLPAGCREEAMTAATTSAEALLLGEQTDGVARLTLNRPNQFKALSSALIAEMQVALDSIAADGIFGFRRFELSGFESLG